MNSQIYENDDEPEKKKTDSDFEARLDEFDRVMRQTAERQRSLAEPVHKTVVATPTAMHHKITLGAVMVAAGFQATDADAFVGLLSSQASRLHSALAAGTISYAGKTAGQALADLLDRKASEFEARGIYVTWQRRFSLYAEDRAEWLKRDMEFCLEGAWRALEMTADQRWLVRVTCRVLRLPMPGHLLRGQAADWLETHGANL
ncbi:MAG: hypothetical protein MK010_08115, partial [Erythrobacter sp.]|nr:hypothetical protein [Erythrobacter sp.]